jgi:hypothetical protein
MRSLFNAVVASIILVSVLLFAPCEAFAQSALRPAHHLAPVPYFPEALLNAPPDSARPAAAATPAAVSEDETETAGSPPVTAAGSWTNVNANNLPNASLANPLLLTDGTVIFANADTPVWYKLTPDINGSYVNGTWSQIASLPVIGSTQYAPQYFASAVLPDGKVIIMGGEYNNGNSPVWTNLGALYDPQADSWTPVAPPSPSDPNEAWYQIGDAASVVLPDGTFMLSACCADPTANALFNESNLSWTNIGGPTAGQDYQDEQGYELLPNDNVLTVDVWTNYPKGGATNAEQYVSSSQSWISAGNTTDSLVDPAACGNWEIGPAVTRQNGSLVAFGGNTGCQSPPQKDKTSIYHVAQNNWTAGPNIPSICGTDGATPCDLADAPAASLPTGSILFAASSGYGNTPTHFFEFTAANTIIQVPDELENAASSGAYYYNFLVLPTGQILSTDFSNIAEVYNPVGSPNASWAPTIGTVPSTLAIGQTYQLGGSQLSGLTQGAYYGDDVQGATNYPLVRITNNATGHVFYARTFGDSNMSIAPGSNAVTNFTLAAATESGLSSLQVVANGIASKKVAVTVGNKIPTTTQLAASNTSPPFGSTISITATVLGGTGTSKKPIPGPTGSILFKTASGTLGSATLSGGSAQLITSGLTIGKHTVTAVYSGDSSYDTSQTSIVITVVAATTTTSMSSSANPSAAGQSVTFTAQVDPQYTGTPSGTVTFKGGSGSPTYGTATLSNGIATLTISNLAIGNHAIQAYYNGSSTFQNSVSSGFNQTVDQANTSVTLTSSPNPATVNQSVTFTATVSAQTPSTGTPTGTVQFKNGSTVRGTATLSNGVATLTTSFATSGSRSFTAVYVGNSAYSSSTSAPDIQGVN